MGIGVKTRLRQLAEAAAFSALFSMKNRWRVLHLLGWKSLGRSSFKSGGFINGYNIAIEGSCYFNRGVFIDAAAQVTIGRDSMFGPRSMIITSSHEIGDHTRRGGPSTYKPVRIGNGCWMGAGAVVLPGVKVADGCIIAAGAVVAHSTEPDGIYAGVPARRIRDLDESGRVSTPR